MPQFYCSLPNTKKSGRIPCLITDDPEAIAAFIKRWDQPGRGVYHCINPLRSGATRRSIDDVDVIARIPVDIDFKDLVDAPAEIEQRLRGLPLQPTWVRRSGGGLHVGYELKEPIEPTDAEYFTRACELHKTLAACLSGDPAVTHPAALLRVEGSHNTKRGAPVLVETVWGSGKPVDITDIEAMVDLLPEGGVFARRAVNGHDKHPPQGGERKEPIDADARLAAMRYHGAGNAAINITWWECMGSLLRQGLPVIDVIDRLHAAAERNCQDDPNKARWRNDLAKMASRWLVHEPDFVASLETDLYGKWMDDVAAGKRPSLSWQRGAGLQVRGHKDRTAHERNAEQPEATAKSCPETDVGNSPRKFRFKLVPFGELRPGLEPLYLVDELIPVAGLVDVWGKAKCYKSFWTLDLMLHVAMGWEYRDRYVRQGAVVYCAFEGAHGYKKRVEALRRHYAIAADAAVPLYVMPGQANLIAEHKLLITEIAAQLGDVKPVSVVLDTLNKSLFGSENKDVDMGAYVRAAEAIRDYFGCVVIIVHHCGYDDTRPRGHSSLPGAVDAQLAVTRTEEIITVTVEMMRDGPEDTQVISAAEVVDVGQDQNGKTLTSLVVVPSEATPAGKHHGWPRGLAVFHTALKATLAAHGQAFQPEVGVLPVRAVDQWMVRDRFYATYAEAEEDEKKRQAKIQKAFVRAVGEAQSRGVAKMRRTDSGQTMIWLPERGEAL